MIKILKLALNVNKRPFLYLCYGKFSGLTPTSRFAYSVFDLLSELVWLQQKNGYNLTFIGIYRLIKSICFENLLVIHKNLAYCFFLMHKLQYSY